ncbi:Gfo/Idh/MocA family protein [Raoultella ornithinolytica]|uniref:Gfo/Idh/MocA family protein n=1 Tax=Raoultella ornithinolytica TaxID=54291 RepID=UPI001156DF09|nr:Gfo/Idh/MocA family oxidoreductase [Raoultella ornithinolytica]
MKSVGKVKVGIVGLGMVCYSHIKAYNSHSHAEVVAVCDLNEEHAKAVAEKYGIPKYYTSYDEMLKDPDINTIDITTPTFLHAKMTISAAKAGKNIHCEKPFCLTLEEGLEACRVAEENGVTLMVGESYIFMSSIMEARKLIDSGAIGKPQQIRQRFGAWIEKEGVMDEREVTDDRGWRMDSSKAGGNGFPWMFDHCVHFFSTAEYLMNDSKIKEVYSVMSDISWMGKEQKHDTDKSKMHLYGTNTAGDIPIMTWTYEDSACQGVWMRAEYLNGKYDPMTGFSVTVIGDKGMIEVLGEGGSGLQQNGIDAHLVLHRKGQGAIHYRFEEGGDDIWKSDVSYYSAAHVNQIHEFIDALVAGKEPRYNGRDGTRAVQTTIAAICSAKEGVPVKVAETTDARLMQ